MMKPYKIPTIKLSYVNDNPIEATTIRNSKDSAMIFRDSFESGEIEMQEYFKVLYLNNRNKILGIHTVSMGGCEATVVDMKILFSGALLAKASAIIVCHNHPSGELKPSIEDNKLTCQIQEGSKLLGMKLLDHIILSSAGFYSYADESRLTLA